MKKIFILLILLVFTFAEPNAAFAKKRIGKIFLERHQVFDSTLKKDWFFLAPLGNSLHYLTREYVIDDEILFWEGDDLDYDIIQETERNLRNLNYFQLVKIELDSVNDYIEDVHIITQDLWSTDPSFLYGSGGDIYSIGGRLTEKNLLGTGAHISLEALYRSENDIKWQGTGQVILNRLFRTDYYLDAKLLSNKYRTEQYLSVYKPYRTLDTKNNYGFNVTNMYGNDFVYNNGNGKELKDFHERKLSFWYSNAWRKNDRIFATLMVELEDVKRADSTFRLALENSGKVYLAFSSVAEKYHQVSKINSYLVEDLPVGGWGTAILGKTFKMGDNGINMYYCAAQGEKSYLWGDLYVFAQVTGSSGFLSSEGLFTYQDATLLGFYRLSEDFLLTARFKQQNVWNWFANRQLILDNDYGLRGLPANSQTGDNRMLGNVELRYFPDFNIWFVGVGGALFYDFGSVWRQQTDLNKTQWNNCLGLGLRFFNNKSKGSSGVIRVEFAYNFKEKKLGNIIIASDQLFSAFTKHVFKLPQIFGIEFEQ